MSSFDYETRGPLYAYGTTATQTVRKGIAYKKDDVKCDFVGQITAEYYLLPIKTFIPGLYAITNMNISNFYKLNNIQGRDNDMFQMGMEGGLVFNINSREKDKERSILSVSLYTRFEDITDTRRTPVQKDGDVETPVMESREDYLKRNLSFGVKIGVPIVLPQL